MLDRINKWGKSVWFCVWSLGSLCFLKNPSSELNDLTAIQFSEVLYILSAKEIKMSREAFFHYRNFHFKMSRFFPIFLVEPISSMECFREERALFSLFVSSLCTKGVQSDEILSMLVSFLACLSSCETGDHELKPEDPEVLFLPETGSAVGYTRRSDWTVSNGLV